MSFQIWNRRYTGSKYKLADWICELIKNNCTGDSFCELFAGTAIISSQMLPIMKKIYINDFLYSNKVIYEAFFSKDAYDYKRLIQIKEDFNKINVENLKPNYVSKNFGNKFFSYNDALKIGYIREQINKIKDINNREKSILLTSLIYSFDRSANTVGHYDAYIKGKTIKDSFMYELIEPLNIGKCETYISREDANKFAKNVHCDIVYIDPPYNSRQYSRFYHVLENIASWKKPNLFGEACKPAPENMSEYCRASATKTFEDLIQSLDCKYIVVSYNNTYTSKSSSSKNKISLESINSILEKKGKVSVFEKSHRYFDAGKTNFLDHKELIFITEVKYVAE